MMGINEKDGNNQWTRITMTRKSEKIRKGFQEEKQRWCTMSCFG